MRGAAVAGLCLATAVAGAVIGHVRMPNDLATLRSPETPYCMVDREVPEYLTVAGPAGGWITVDGQDHDALTLITGDYAEEVAPDAGPFDGLLYNVPGPGVVAVDGIECVTT